MLKEYYAIDKQFPKRKPFLLSEATFNKFPNSYEWVTKPHVDIPVRPIVIKKIAPVQMVDLSGTVKEILKQLEYVTDKEYLLSLHEAEEKGQNRLSVKKAIKFVQYKNPRSGKWGVLNRFTAEIIDHFDKKQPHIPVAKKRATQPPD